MDRLFEDFANEAGMRGGTEGNPPAFNGVHS